MPSETSEAAKQRQAAVEKRKEETYQQTLHNSQVSLNEYTSYKTASGGPKDDESDLDSSLEMRWEHRGQQSVKFSSPGEATLKDNQSRSFIHHFDLRVEVKVFPRKKGRQFYCTIILALSKSAEWLLSTLQQHLQDNLIGLWQHPTDCKQVTEIG
jgi:hypothetical protein